MSEIFLVELLDGVENSLYWFVWSPEHGPLIGERGETSQHVLWRFRYLYRIKDSIQTYVSNVRLDVPRLCDFLANREGFRDSMVSAMRRSRELAQMSCK